MTQKANNAVTGNILNKGGASILTCTVLLTGAVVTVAHAESELTSTATQQQKVGLNQVNYFKIAGYTSGVKAYARTGGASNNSVGDATGSLTVRGIATVGYQLAAVTENFADKIGSSDKNQFENEDANGLPEPLTYQWYRSPGKCTTTEKQSFVPLDNDSGTTTEADEKWCKINGANEATYTLTHNDINQDISVTIAYSNSWGKSESYISQEYISDICASFPDFNNPPHFGCPINAAFIFNDSFE